MSSPHSAEQLAISQHPLRESLTDEEWKQLGKDVQFCRASWPIGLVVERFAEMASKDALALGIELKESYYRQAVKNCERAHLEHQEKAGEAMLPGFA